VRILVFHGYLLRGTGSNVYNAEIAAALVRLGHEVHLLCQDRDPLELDFVDAAGDWDRGALRVQERRRPARCTVYRPNIGGLLPVYVADRTHLHHRFLNIGFSQRRAVAYIYVWCATLAGAALATRFIRPHAHGSWHLWRTVAVLVIGLAALAASVYMVYLLEIVKLANPRIRRREEAARAAAARRTA